MSILVAIGCIAAIVYIWREAIDLTGAILFTVAFGVVAVAFGVVTFFNLRDALRDRIRKVRSGKRARSVH